MMSSLARTTGSIGDHMRTYVVTTGIIFGLLTGAHLWRWAVERHLLRDPFHVSVTIGSALLCFWAWRVARAAPRS